LESDPQLAGFFDFKNFASLIVAAFGADAMRHFLFVAVGALGKGVPFERVMGAAGGSAFLRVSPFRIRHGYEFLSGIFA
jgi:hypothetical protein